MDYLVVFLPSWSRERTTYLCSCETQTNYRCTIRASNTELCYPLFFHIINPETDEVLFEDKKIKISTFPLSHGIDCNGFLFEEKRSPRKIISEKVKQYNIPVEQIKTIKNGKNFISEDGRVIFNSELTIENKKPSSYAFVQILNIVNL